MTNSKGHSTAPSEDPRLKRGALLVFLAGAIPFLFGVTTVIFVWIGVVQPDQPWRAIMPPGSHAPFTLSEVRGFNPGLGDELVMSKHVHYSILIAIGLLIMTLSRFALRRGERWAWWVLVVTILLVGWNDAITSLSFGHLPFPLVPAILATIGLAVARPAVFSNRESPPPG